MASEADRRAAPWENLALVCQKCMAKLDGGYGRKGEKSLDDALRSKLRERGERRALRIVPVPCLGICPRRAVAVVSAEQPATVLVVPAGMKTKQVLRALGRM